MDIGQGPEEQVDQCMVANMALQHIDADMAAAHPQLTVGRDHIDLVGRDRRLLLHLAHFILVTPCNMAVALLSWVGDR